MAEAIDLCTMLICPRFKKNLFVQEYWIYKLDTLQQKSPNFVAWQPCFGGWGWGRREPGPASSGLACMHMHTSLPHA